MQGKGMQEYLSDKQGRCLQGWRPGTSGASCKLRRRERRGEKKEDGKGKDGRQERGNQRASEIEA